MAQITSEKSELPQPGSPTGSPAVFLHPEKILSLSPRQQATLDLLVMFISARGYPPTARELADLLGVSSPNAAREHLRALERKGVITVARGISRGITILGDKAPTLATSVPPKITEPCHNDLPSAAAPKTKAVVELRVEPESPQTLFARPKRIRWESPAYLKWVKAQPCQCCGMPADDAHHLTGYGQGGTGTKAHDSLTIPLCRRHHDELHRDLRTFENNYGTQPEMIINLLDRAFALGVLA
jgi:DNA-binding Lrp family transcriptional regulator